MEACMARPSWIRAAVSTMMCVRHTHTMAYSIGVGAQLTLINFIHRKFDSSQ